MRAPRTGRCDSSASVFLAKTAMASVGALREGGADLAFERRGHQALVAVGDRGVQGLGKDTAAARDAASQQIDRLLLVNAHAYAQLALRLAAVDGEDAVVGNLAYGFGKIVVGLVHGLFVRIHGLNANGSGVVGERAQGVGVLRVVGDYLGDDILPPLRWRSRLLR